MDSANSAAIRSFCDRASKIDSMSWRSRSGMQRNVGQGYDGAAVMEGSFKGVQALIRKQYPEALYVHCCSHSLNLALRHSYLQSVRNCIGKVRSVVVFFKNSPKRMTSLRDEIKTENPGSRWKTLASMCETSERAEWLLSLRNPSSQPNRENIPNIRIDEVKKNLFSNDSNSEAGIYTVETENSGNITDDATKKTLEANARSTNNKSDNKEQHHVDDDSNHGEQLRVQHANLVDEASTLRQVVKAEILSHIKRLNKKDQRKFIQSSGDHDFIAKLDQMDNVEKSLKIKIPNNVKLNLELSGYGNSVTLADISDKDIKDIELFARTDLKELIPDWNEYFGKIRKENNSDISTPFLRAANARSTNNKSDNKEQHHVDDDSNHGEQLRVQHANLVDEASTLRQVVKAEILSHIKRLNKKDQRKFIQSSGDHDFIAKLDQMDNVEKFLKFKIPNNVKLNLELSGYGNSVTLADISDKDIKDIELFARTDLKELVPNWNEYFGVFEEETDLFRFFPGEKVLIYKMIVCS
ncbi:unnamed protein product [Phaedon cochleariae]|uniref:Uncharacterized protein n=1 Tax=Phaedon cochleariae TaxID=80249 RepID=A0A9P0GSL7_PHACE|nr:unnamed protein product [Phaedon cochleariae]